jgi:hypothetical protein
MRYGWDMERYGSPYAPGPAYLEEQGFGPFTGIGPRNYRRSDQRIYEDVCDRLMRHGGINAADIEVKVEEGEVTLSGTVDSPWTRRAVEDTALTVLGVREVNNLLRMSQKGASQESYYSFQTGRELFNTGMPVVGRDGGLIGTIAEVRCYDFLVRRESDPDIFVPFGACLKTNGGVVLDIPAAAIDQQNWPIA